jgi:hypothetical protein
LTDDDLEYHEDQEEEWTDKLARKARKGVDDLPTGPT